MCFCLLELCVYGKISQNNSEETDEKKPFKGRQSQV